MNNVASGAKWKKKEVIISGVEINLEPQAPEILGWRESTARMDTMSDQRMR